MMDLKVTDMTYKKTHQKAKIIFYALDGSRAFKKRNYLGEESKLLLIHDKVS
jgi:hypothetical protein